MSDLFEPNYPVLTFLFIKKFGLYYVLVGILAFVRFLVGPWLSRLFALIATGACVAAVAFTYAPSVPISEIVDHPEYPTLIGYSNLYNGMVGPLIVAALFLLSTAFRKGRAVWIDFLFLAFTFVLIILWGATTYLV